MRPILFHIGSFPVRSYGIMILVGFFAGIWLIRKRAARYGLDPQKVTDPCFYALIAGIIGARVVYMLQEYGYYAKHLNEVFSLNFAGLTSFGGFLFGAIAVIWWAAKNRVRVATLLDLVAPGFMLAHVFGRVGCYLNGCCYGGVCDASLPWATKFIDAPGLHHPAQIYDSLMNLAGIGLIVWYERSRLKPGQITGTFLFLHGLSRFIYEFWRAGTDEQVAKGQASSTYWGSLPITQAQGVALLMMAIGVGVWAWSRQYAEPMSAQNSKPSEPEPPAEAALAG